MKKSIHFFIAGLLLMIIIYLLWPLSSEKYKITVDKKKLAFKQHFLKNRSTNQADSLPNILLIMVDDLGMADLSLYGEGYPNTPNIDQLGAEGIIFNNAYVTSPVCSPSRAAMLTGRYQHRFGYHFQMHERYLKNRLEYLGFKYFVDSAPWLPKWMDEVPDSQAVQNQGLPPSEILLPELLRTKGYATALIGKWHLGADSLRAPCNFGFDYQYGFYASHSLFAYENTPGIHDQKVEGEFTDPHIWSGQRDGAHAIYKNCEEIMVKEYLTDRFTTEAIDYLGKHKDQPFFLYLSYNAPHTPLQAPVKYLKEFNHINDPVKQTYYAMIRNLDENIGKLLGALESLHLSDNTLIFFISDNGGAEYTFTTENGNYKGGKITNFEGGIKVPFIIRWTKKIKAGTFNPIVSSMDIFKTVTDVTGINLPDDRVYDGVNVLPFISGNKNTLPHEHLFWQRGINKAIRSNEWKLSLNEEENDTVLFHISRDPFEEKDLSRTKKRLANQLADIHARWSSTLSKPLWPSMVYYEYMDEHKRYYFDQ